MRCGECERKGYAYCFLYPHSVPKVEIVAETRMIPVTTYSVKRVSR